MTHPIIKTDNYLLVVDDSDMVRRGFRLDITRMSVGIIDDDFFYNTRKDLFKKIISHLPLNGAPVLEGVDLLPPYSRHQEDGVKELGNTMFRNKIDSLEEIHSDYILGVTDGYKKAREKYNLTLNKLIDMYIEKTGYGMDMWSKEENETMSTIADIIESLQQPKLPITFECEMEEGLINQQTKINDWGLRPKTTTINGRIVWVGKYIY